MPLRRNAGQRMRNQGVLTGKPEPDVLRPIPEKPSPRAVGGPGQPRRFPGWLGRGKRALPRTARAVAAVAGGAHGAVLRAGGRALRRWWFVTRGAAGRAHHLSLQAISAQPAGNASASFHSLWFDRGADAEPADASLRRVTVPDSAWHAAVGVPVGILCGCFSLDRRVLPAADDLGPQHPGRRADSADLLALRHRRIAEDHVHLHRLRGVHHLRHGHGDRRGPRGRTSTRPTRWGRAAGRSIMKVLVPLAMPEHLQLVAAACSALAFGYIMLAELVKFGGESGGLGDIINTSQRRGPQTHILLVLMIIPVVALAIDQLLFWIQKELFPYRYGGAGMLHSVRARRHARLGRPEGAGLRPAVPGGCWRADLAEASANRRSAHPTKSS